MNDLAFCFTVMAAALVVGWPLWALDETLARAAGRLDRARVSIRVRAYARRIDRDENHLRKWVTFIVDLAIMDGLHLTETEAFYCLKAAIALSDTGTMPLEKAIHAVASNL